MKSGVKKWALALSVHLLPLSVLGTSVSLAWAQRQDIEGRYSTQVKYGQNELAPSWMPRKWVRPFLREVHLDASEALFARSLVEVESTLVSSKWVRRVVDLRRSYDGDVELSLEVRRPVCLLVNRGHRRYFSRDLVELEPFYRSGESELAGGVVVPEVDVSQIARGSAAQKERWLAEMMAFVLEWGSRSALGEAMVLRGLEMQPYAAESTSECRLVCQVWDRRFNREVKLTWGIHREYNELEDRYAADKWQALEEAIAQSRPFDALDLRYKKLEITY